MLVYAETDVEDKEMKLCELWEAENWLRLDTITSNTRHTVVLLLPFLSFSEPCCWS